MVLRPFLQVQYNVVHALTRTLHDCSSTHPLHPPPPAHPHPIQSIGDVFTVPNLLPGCLKPDGMLRNGKVGEHEKELPDDIRDLFTALVEKELTEEQANWMYNGGKSF